MNISYGTWSENRRFPMTSRSQVLGIYTRRHVIAPLYAHLADRLPHTGLYKFLNACKSTLNTVTKRGRHVLTLLACELETKGQSGTPVLHTACNVSHDAERQNNNVLHTGCNSTRDTEQQQPLRWQGQARGAVVAVPHGDCSTTRRAATAGGPQSLHHNRTPSTTRHPCRGVCLTPHPHEYQRTCCPRHEPVLPIDNLL